MDNIIPFLIIAGGLIYKIYQNYQEEMEKARERQKKLSSAPDTPNVEPVSKRKLGRPKPQKIVLTRRDEPQSAPLVSARPDVMIPTEVERVRMERQRRKAVKQLEIQELEATEETASPSPSISAEQFDLRAAVIQSVILERPYK